MGFISYEISEKYINLYEKEYNKTIRNIGNLPFSTSKINLRVIFNDINIKEHEILVRLKNILKWIKDDSDFNI